MKNKLLQMMVVAALVIFMSTLSSCKKETTTPNAEITHSKLYNKCWYNKDGNGQPDNYFYTAGNKIYYGCNNPGIATWEWETGDTMTVYTPAPLTLVFTEISDNKMSWIANGSIVAKFTDAP